MWIDVGTSTRSSLLSDMLMLAPNRVDGLIGIGLEVSPERLEAHRSFVNAALSTHPEIAARWTQFEFAASSACGKRVVGEQFSLAGKQIKEVLNRAKRGEGTRKSKTNKTFTEIQRLITPDGPMT